MPPRSVPPLGSPRTGVIRIRALGALHVSRSGEPSAALTQPRRVALVAYLALAEPRGMHSRDTLVALLWPEAGAAKGRRALRNALHGLRRSLGSGVLATAGHDLVGLDPARVTCDVHELESALAADGAGEALAQYRELAEGFHVSEAPEFERWLDGARARIRERLRQAVLTRAKHLEASGPREAALRLLEGLCTLDPDDEPVLRRYLELALAAGDLPAAHRAYRAYVARIADEFGVTPSPETSALMGARLMSPAEGPVATMRGVAGGLPLLAEARPGEGQLPARVPPTRVHEAYVLYVRGTYLFLRAAHVGGRAEDLEEARQVFEQALARDPGFGWAYAGLSNYYATAAARNLLRPFAAFFGKAIELSRRALDLDPSLAVPRVHFGVQAMYLDGDWERAREEFSRAVELDPSYAEARRFLGIYFGAMGAHEAGLQQLREAVRLEPRIPLFRNSVADALLSLGRPTEAVEHLHAALELDPGYRAARERLLRCQERLGQFAEALVARRLVGPTDIVDRFAVAFAQDGAEGYRRERAAELRSLIERLTSVLRLPLENAGDLLNPPELRLALAHAELGEWDEAFRWEERAAASNPGRRQWFVGRPELSPLAPWRGRASRGEHWADDG